MKLLARSVPFHQAKKILSDESFCDIIKIKSFVRNKEKFVKRRQRLVGPNGSTLKAIELLTNCYVLVQGQTCCVMGTMKGLKTVRRIVEDCFQNIHPVYHIKEMMIKRELEKDENLKDENWERFLPSFKKRNVQSKKLKKKKEGKKKVRELFPPQQMPRKEDLLMESGEYFLSKEQRDAKKRNSVMEKQAENSAVTKRKRAEVFEAKEEHVDSAVKRRKVSEATSSKASSSTANNSLPDKSVPGINSFYINFTRINYFNKTHKIYYSGPDLFNTLFNDELKKKLKAKGAKTKKGEKGKAAKDFML